MDLLDQILMEEASKLEITVSQLEMIWTQASDEEIDKITFFGDPTQEQKELVKQLVTKYCTEWIK